VLILSGHAGVESSPEHFRLVSSLAKNPMRFCVLGTPFGRHFPDARSAWPKRILSGHAGFIILRSHGRREPSQRIAIVPGHPLRWVSLQLLRVPLQPGEVVEGIGSVQLAGVNQAHEQIADPGAVQRLVEERVFAVQNGFLEGTLDDVVIERRAWLLKEQRQLRPVIQ